MIVRIPTLSTWFYLFSPIWYSSRQPCRYAAAAAATIYLCCCGSEETELTELNWTDWTDWEPAPGTFGRIYGYMHAAAAAAYILLWHSLTWSFFYLHTILPIFIYPYIAHTNHIFTSDSRYCTYSFQISQKPEFSQSPTISTWFYTGAWKCCLNMLNVLPRCYRDVTAMLPRDRFAP